MSAEPLAIEAIGAEKSEDVREVAPTRGVSFWGTVVTMLNVFVGGGSVVLPYAFRLSGWLFVPVLLAVGLLMGFTLWIMGFLLQSLDSRADEMGLPRSQRDWGFIGYVAFGNVGRFLFAGCMFFDLAGGALVLMSIVIEQLPFLLPIRHCDCRAFLHSGYFVLPTPEESFLVDGRGWHGFSALFGARPSDHRSPTPFLA